MRSAWSQAFAEPYLFFDDAMRAERFVMALLLLDRFYLDDQPVNGL